MLIPLPISVASNIDLALIAMADMVDSDADSHRSPTEGLPPARGRFTPTFSCMLARRYDT